jgi:guanylate kinase
MAKILIVGKRASGKDSIGKVLESKGLKKCVFNTTRPKRSNEEEGVDYFFSECKGKIMVEESYNDWVYALSEENWNSGDFAIFTPAYLKQIPADIREDCLVIYLDVPESVRRSRLQSRNDADKVERRISADQIDFSDFHDYDWKILDSQLKSFEDYNPFAEVLFNRALELIHSSYSVEEISEILDKEWDKERPPLPNETLESYVISRLHLKLGAVMTINEGGKYLFVYIDAMSKRLSTVGNLSTTTAADSLFDELTKSAFRKVRETQLGIAESVLLVQSVKDSFSFGSLPKRVRDNINGFLAKFNHKK